MYMHNFSTETYSTAYVESHLLNLATIRHNKCEIVISEAESRCAACKNHRKSLHAMYTRIQRSTSKENKTAPCSHVNYCHLSTPEKEERLSNLHKASRVANRHISRLRARLEEAILNTGEAMDEEMHEGLRSIMVESKAQIHEKFPPDSFGRIFWEQQNKPFFVKMTVVLSFDVFLYFFLSN